MEKLICPACGAPLAPDSTQPLITCEYCDTAVENKYYVAPAVEEKTVEPAADAPESAETVTEEEENVSGGSLMKTLLGVGGALAANALRRRSRTATVHRPSASRPALHGHRPAAPHRPPEPPRMGSMNARPTHAVRPGSARPQSRPGSMRGPAMRGGRGMGGPGGRHR